MQFVDANKFIKNLMLKYWYLTVSQKNIHLILGDGQKTS